MEIQQNNQLGQKYQKTAFDQTKLLIKVQNRAFGSGVKSPNSFWGLHIFNNNEIVNLLLEQYLQYVT